MGKISSYSPMTALQGAELILGDQSGATGTTTPTAIVEYVAGLTETPVIASYARTAAEIAAAITPTNYTYSPGNARRYGSDPTGVADSTGAFQIWINAAWSMFNYVDGQGLWNGGGGAIPIATLTPGKFKLSGSTVLPTGCTVTGEAHPANTTNHTRIVLNSTGTTPARTWAADTLIPSNAIINAGNGYWYRANATGSLWAGTTGSTEPAWPTNSGGTVVDGTVTWTLQGAISAGDNRNMPILKFSRATELGGTTLANQNLDMALQNLEFWAVDLGNNFNDPLGGTGYAWDDYPLGGALFFDCDTVDTRIVSCTFQNTPCGIRLHNIQNGTVASDGFTNQGSGNIWVEACEFDAAAAHVYADNCTLDLVFRNCAFYGGYHKYVGCSGRVIYENCAFYGGTVIDATDSGNNFLVFRVAGGTFDQAQNSDCISIYGAAIADIRGLTFVAANSASTIVLQNADGGGVYDCSINDSGYNSGSQTGLTASAAIKLIDCQNTMVRGNNLTATSGTGTYNGFGILTLSNVRGSSGNFIDGNMVSAPYNGAAYNGQGRSINLASTADVLGSNVNVNDWNATKAGAVALSLVQVPYSSSITFDARSGNLFEITITNATAFTINAPAGASDGQEITIMFVNTTTGSIGAITWNSIFLVYSGALNPAAGASQSIRLLYNGTNWVELWRGANNVPN